MCQDIFIDFLFLRVYKPYMTTDKPRILITVDKDFLARIEDFRFENRISTRSEAIRRLIDQALKKYEEKAKK